MSGPWSTASGWSEERIEILRKEWAAGSSAAEVVEILGGVFTRNAVLGKVWRLGLADTHPSKPRTPPKPRVRIRKPKVSIYAARWGAVDQDTKEPTLPEFDAVVPDPRNLSFEDLGTAHCRYPFGDAAPYLYCGHQRYEDLPYCAAHCRVCYVPPKR
jgi:GcrA cell cycle regulator